MRPRSPPGLLDIINNYDSGLVRFRKIIRKRSIQKWRAAREGDSSYFGRLDVVALGDLLVELLDVGEARDESGRRPVGLLTVEDQFGLRDFGCRGRRRGGATVAARRRVLRLLLVLVT